MQSCAELQIQTLPESSIDAVSQVEQQAHAYPWSYADFLDAAQAGYYTQVLLAHQLVLGYCIAMQAVDEVHLLNLTVTPQYQRQGLARLMLHNLTQWTCSQQARSVWLEVRESNRRALQIYERQGFAHVALRKHYYRANHGQRENAVVMHLDVRAHAVSNSGERPCRFS